MQVLKSLGQIGFRCAPRRFAVLICAAIMGLAGPPLTHAQGNIPVLRGVYQGSSSSMNCVAAGQAQVTVRITNQVNDNFSGQGAATDGAGATVFFSGTVDSTGALQGTYDYSIGGSSGQGTFTGQFDGTATPKTLHLVFSGTFTAGPISCGETITVDATLLTAGGPAADLSITGAASSGTVATGTPITYTLTVKNAGPNDAAGTLVVNPAPPGTSIVAAAASQGACSTTAGLASCSLGTVPNGGTATITITANVFEPAGSTLVDSPNVSSATFDPDLSNNSATISTPVVGGAVIKLVWDEPTPTAGNPTQSPQNLRVEIADSPATDLASRLVVPQDSCTLIAVNVYKSDSAPVLPIPSNLWVAVPPANLQATLAVAPGGSFYVITNLWKCGDTIIESGTSNQASVPAGPTITGLKVTGKVKILGMGFSGLAQVFVDGVGFAKAAALSDSTLLIQKGPLADGTSISDIGTGKSVLITVKNGDGGFATFAFKRP